MCSPFSFGVLIPLSLLGRHFCHFWRPTKNTHTPCPSKILNPLREKNTRVQFKNHMFVFDPELSKFSWSVFMLLDWLPCLWSFNSCDYDIFDIILLRYLCDVMLLWFSIICDLFLAMLSTCILLYVLFENFSQNLTMCSLTIFQRK